MPECDYCGERVRGRAGYGWPDHVPMHEPPWHSACIERYHEVQREIANRVTKPLTTKKDHATLVAPSRKEHPTTTPAATITQRDFAIMRHGLRYLTALVEKGQIDLSPAAVDHTDLLALDIKLDNIIRVMKEKSQHG